MQERLEKAFKKFYPNKRLLASKINDMYISVWYDDGNKESEVKQDAYEFWTKNSEGQMDKLTAELGVGAYTYWHDCWIHEWIHPWDR